MRKNLFFFIILATLLLSGCLPETQASPTSTATATAEASQIPKTDLSLPTEVAVPVSADCTVKTLRPTPGATVQTVYPPITEADWSEGPANARITIVEYGDFQ
jgi:PBP1b-binding outer membrane lipoprotein LpoB